MEPAASNMQPPQKPSHGKFSAIKKHLPLLSIFGTLLLITIGAVIVSLMLEKNHTTPKTKDPLPQKKAQLPPEVKLYRVLTWNPATIFVLGGSSGSQALSSVEFYDPKKRVWEEAPPLLTPRKDAAAAIIDNKIYLFGGSSSSKGPVLSSVEAFDPLTNTWTAKKDLPEARTGALAVPVDEKIYVLGGFGESKQAMKSVVMYDPKNNSWERKADIPGTVSSIRNYTCVNVGTNIFCPGAADNGYTLVYETENNSWESRPTEGRSEMTPGKGVLIGKNIVTMAFNLPNLVISYHLPTDSYVRGPSYKSVSQFATAAAGDYFLVIGGVTDDRATTGNVAAIDTRDYSGWFPLSPLRTARSSHAVVVLPISYSGEKIASLPKSGFECDEKEQEAREKGTAVISGRVLLGSKGAPKIKVSLATTFKADGKGDPGYHRLCTLTDTNGYYSFSSLKAGKYRVGVATDPANPGAYAIPHYKGRQEVLLKEGQTINDYHYYLPEPKSF